MNDIEAGKLIAAVEQLTKEVKELKEDLESIKGQLTKGKGIIIGMVLLSGAAGVSITSVINKLIGG